MEARRHRAGTLIGFVTAVASLLIVAAAPADPPTFYRAGSAVTAATIDVRLPCNSPLSTILASLALSTCSFRQEIASADSSSSRLRIAPAGTARATSTFGGLDKTILLAAKARDRSVVQLPDARAAFGSSTTSSPTIASLAMGPIAIGRMEAEATTTEDSAGHVATRAFASVGGLEIRLQSVLSVGAMAELMKPLTDVLDGPATNPRRGLIDTLNVQLGVVEEGLVREGIKVDLSFPEVSALLRRPLLSIGSMTVETTTDTPARSASSEAHLKQIDLLGGFVHVDSIDVNTAVSIDGTEEGAESRTTQRISGFRLGGNIINLNAGVMTVLGRSVVLTAKARDALDAVIAALGFEIRIAGQPPRTFTAARSAARASTAVLVMAPVIEGRSMFTMTITGPIAQADIAQVFPSGPSLPASPASRALAIALAVVITGLVSAGHLIRRLTLKDRA